MRVGRPVMKHISDFVLLASEWGRKREQRHEGRAQREDPPPRGSDPPWRTRKPPGCWLHGVQLWFSGVFCTVLENTGIDRGRPDPSWLWGGAGGRRWSAVSVPWPLGSQI